jgi:putative hydrolase of the HAD superfamily
MKKPIALVFDLGNVLLPIDLDKTYQAFADLGSIYSAAEIMQFTTEEGLWVAYESGLESCEAFQQRIVQRFNLTCTEQEFKDAFNALLLPIAAETCVYLSELSALYPLYLLSNTSKIHSDVFLNPQYPNFNLFDSFTNIHFSFEMGLVKPDVNIYQQVSDLNNLHNHQIVFFDDNAHNVEAANNFGWDAVLIQPSTSIQQIKKYIQSLC